MRLKLLVVSNFFDTHRGGLEIVAGHLARELAARGFDVTWIATSETPSPARDPEAPVRCVAVDAINLAERRLGVPWPVLGPAAVRSLAREIAAADAVILHDSLYMISMATFLATRRLGKPLVVVQHIGAIAYRNPLLRGLMALGDRLVARPLLARAGQVVFISEAVRGFYGSVPFRRPPLLVFNGVDTAVFRPARSGEKTAARARFGMGRPTALFVGRFVEKKGLHILRETAAARPDIDWVFAGWGVLDPAAWDLPNVRVIRGMSGQDLAELYRAADVFVLPSQGEGFPLVVQEALASGLPVVCGSECGTADPAAAPLLLSIDVTRNVDAVAADVSRGVDEALKDDRGAAAVRFDFARRRYAWSSAADRYAALLRELAGPALDRPVDYAA